MKKNESNAFESNIDAPIFDDPQNLLGDQSFESQSKRSKQYLDYFVESLTKAKCIHEISKLPDKFMKESIENPALAHLRIHYDWKAKDLAYYELKHSLAERRVLHSKYFHSLMVFSLPEVELSRAWLRFIEVFFDKSEMLQRNFHRDEAVWLAVEECWCRYLLRESNIDAKKFGLPLVNSQGRVLGKKQHLSYIDHFVTACEETLSTGIPKRSPVGFANPMSPKDGFSNLLLVLAIKQANCNDDQHLESAVKNLLKAIRDSNTQAKDSPLCQIVRMHKGHLKITGKGRKSFKPESPKKPKTKGFGADVKLCNEIRPS
jgi:hypothetical protein